MPHRPPYGSSLDLEFLRPWQRPQHTPGEVPPISCISVVVVLASAASVSGGKSRVSQWGMGNAMHITASVFINDNESGLHEDYKKWLEGLAPFDASAQRYAHNRTGEDNADAHMKRQIMGR